jgi:hypothetical protein
MFETLSANMRISIALAAMMAAMIGTVLLLGSAHIGPLSNPVGGAGEL